MADPRDSRAGFTSMLSMSHLPEDFCPGYITLIEIGIHVRLNRHRSVKFSGLHWHVGTSPTAPSGKRIPADARRIIMVAYPSAAMFEDGYLAFFGSLPHPGKQQIQGECLADRGEFRTGPEINGTM